LTARPNPNVYDSEILAALGIYPCPGLTVAHVRAQMWQESQGDPWAASSAACLGLMQIKPSTARDDILPGRGVEDVQEWTPFDPGESLRCGVWYMRWLLESYTDRLPGFTERWRFSLASYNAGRSRVNRALIRARKEMSPEYSVYRRWLAANKPPGPWQLWENVAPLVQARTGSEPIVYVERIAHYLREFQ